MQNEQRLLAGVRQLDSEVLTEVHNLYYPAIFRYVAYRVGSQQTAEDLTSEVFIRLLKAVRERSAPSNTLKGWLFGVASRVVADYHRQRYREEKYELVSTDIAEAIDPAQAASQKQTFSILASAIRQLTDDQQEVIALRFGYGLPIREVAENMGKSEGAVKQLQARAVARLTELMTLGSSI